MNILYYKKIGIDILMFWRSILGFIPGLAAPTAIGILIFNFVKFTSIPQFVLWILFYCAVYMVSMWLFGLNQYEKETVRGVLLKLRCTKT